MKCCATGRIAAAAVVASAAVAIGGAPAAAVNPGCGPRTASVSSAAHTEGGPSSGAQLSFVVTTTGCAAATVLYQTTEDLFSLPTATAFADYSPVAGGLVWAAGDTTDRVINVSVVGERLVEMDEVFALELFNPVGLTLTRADAVGTIVNDDLLRIEPAPGGGDSEPDCSRPAPTCEVVILTSAPAAMDVTVHFATRDGTATAGDDYVGVPDRTLTIPAGGTRATVKITIRAERIMARAEFFYLTIFAPSAGVVTTAERRVTIPVP